MRKNSCITPENCILLFFTGSFAGYLWEVALFFLMEGRFCNRGFFHGPWLPVYGSGALLIFLLLYSHRKRPVYCFVCSALIGAAVEFFTGRLLHTVFCRRYWDYTGEFMHIGGYVCLYSVLGFALSGLLFNCVIAPFLLTRFVRLPPAARRLILGAISAAFLADLVFSLYSPNTGAGIAAPSLSMR